ncbi:GD14246 [Drosophila simulans]|uniref:GD14246 n=1 Tax=Drosophila simulans TaxID=7240 RepID=B4QP76_DROSI|nr:GD14246 [Drosophila simulans]
MISSKKSLLIWAYAIGCFDLISALLFSMVSLKTICDHRHPRCVRAWIIFSCVGIMVEMCLVLYAVFNESTFQMGLIKNGLLLMVGLIVECIFLYIVQRFYVTLAFCQACHKAIASRIAQQQSCMELETEYGHQKHHYNLGETKRPIENQNRRGKIVPNAPTQPMKMGLFRPSDISSTT